jgi:cytochrome c
MLEYQGFVWDEDNLSIWLQNPKKMISKTKMIFPGLKKQDQIDALIEYLKSK